MSPPIALPRWILAGILAGALIVLAWNIDRLPPAIGPNREFTKRAFPNGWTPDFTAALLRQQFVTPGQITTILLLVGGDAIQKAVAQLSGTYEYLPITPVVFSYGWVSYAFILLANAIGNNTYFAPPDYPGVIVSLKSGDKRDIRSWVLARLLRDLEHSLDPNGKIANRDTQERIALYVATYQVDPSKLANHRHLRPKRDWVWWSFLVPLSIQLVVAAIPMMPTPDRSEPNFYILLIVVVGNLLALVTGSLQSSRTEKYGNRGVQLGCRDMFAITKGNGHNIVIIILPNSFDQVSGEGGNSGDQVSLSSLPYLAEMATSSYRPSYASRVRAVLLSFAWILLLLIIGGSTADTWCLLVVGGVGMMHTILVAGIHRSSDAHGIPLRHLGNDWEIQSNRVIDALVALDRKIPGAGHMLRGEFFTGPERAEDQQAWNAVMTVEGKTEEEMKKMPREERVRKSIQERLASWQTGAFIAIPQQQ